jgi:hypothetical protein
MALDLSRFFFVFGHTAPSPRFDSGCRGTACGERKSLNFQRFSSRSFLA